MTIYIISAGTGRDGDEWWIAEICLTREIAERRSAELAAGNPMHDYNEVEEWLVTTK